MPERKTIILGIGNLLFSDEGIGIHVIEALKKHSLPENVELVDGSVLGFDLLPLLEDCGRLIVIDAIAADAPPGTVYSFDAAEVMEQMKTKTIPVSAHDFDFFQVLALMRQLKKMPPARIIAVVPQAMSPGTELSPLLKKKMPQIIQTISTYAVE